jgi:uncharacterized membrane protein
MLSLTLAALCFAGLHLLISGTPLRAVMVARVGERAYLALFSLLSAALLAWLIWAYGQARTPMPTALHEWRVIASALNLVAFLLIVLGLLTPGPTIVGAGSLLERGTGPRGVHRITRHPFLWGIALWAVTHMAFNPEGPNLLFFGTFLLVALAGTFSIDGKRARRHGEAWQRYAAQTSSLPFAALLQRRTQLVLSEFGWWKPLAGLAAFAAFALLHARFFGVPAW